jgi:hypothetical protein
VRGVDLLAAFCHTSQTSQNRELAALEYPTRFRRFLAWRRLPLALAFIAMVLASPALFIGFQVDDWLQVLAHTGKGGELGFDLTPFDMFTFVDGDPASVQHAMDFGFLPWWNDKSILLSFWRPLTILTHMLDYLIWPDSPALMHLHSLIWLGLATAAAALFYRRVIDAPWVAGLAALLFAVEDAHALPAAWLANRNSLIAVTFSLLALLAHIRWRRHRDWAAGLAAPALLLLALLAKEAGIATTAWLFAYAVFLDKGPVWKRLRTLIPYAAVVIGWRIVYVLLGYGIRGGHVYRDPIREPIEYWLYAAERGPVLFFSQWAVPVADLHIALPRAVQLFLLAAALLFAAFWLVLFFPLLRRNARARFFAAGMVLSILPVCAAFPSDRLLAFPGIGALGLLAIFLAEWKTIFADRAVLMRWLARAAAVFFIVMHLILAPLLLTGRVVAWGVIGDIMNRVVLEAPLGDDVENSTIVIVNAPNIFFTSYLPVARLATGLPVPDAVRSLAPNTPRAKVPIRITRPDAYTLIYEPEGGYPWFLTRNADNPFDTGDIVRIRGMEIEILANAPQGWPAAVQYRFEVPLEDETLVWLKFDWKAGGYQPFLPPAVGESLQL